MTYHRLVKIERYKMQSDMVHVILIQNIFHVAALLKYVYIIQTDMVYVIFNTQYVSRNILSIILCVPHLFVFYIYIF